MQDIYAVIDIGTLKVKTEIAKITSPGVLQRIEAWNTLTCFGVGLEENKGCPEEKNLLTILGELKRIKEELKKHKVNKFRVVSTHVMRRLRNKEEVMERIQRETGFVVECISEREEAELFFQAVLKSFQKSNRDYVVIDVGGGSVQVLLGREEGLERAHSMKTGTISLQEKFTKDPNNPKSFTTMEDIERMKDCIMQELLPLERKDGIPLVYGSSMIIDVMKIVNIPLEKHGNSETHPYKTYAHHLEKIIKTTLPMTYEERDAHWSSLPHHYGWGIDKGFLNAITIAEHFKSPYIIPSNANIAQGIILTMSESK